MVLRRWWEEKFKLPSTHELYQNETLFNLLVAYYEDLFDDDSVAALDAIRGEDGEVVFEDLEDPLLAKWERELAQGITPDLEEGLSDKEREKLKSERDRKKGARELANVNDDFGSVSRRAMDEYRSKYVVPGSKEDATLRRAADARRAPVPNLLGQDAKSRGRGVR